MIRFNKEISLYIKKINYMDERKIRDIIETMIEWNLLDSNRLYDTNYVIEQVTTYIKARNFVYENFKGCF